MQYIDLSSGRKISKLCFGCEPLGGKDWGDFNLPKINMAIQKSLEIGVDFFDTADVYGLGMAEKRLANILGSKRHDVTIATKGGVSWSKGKSDKRADTSIDCSAKHIKNSVENSLRRLKLDHLPIYYIHYPDPNVDVRDTFECLNQLKDQGKIELIGCSNYNSKQLLQACEVANISLLQIPINLIIGKPEQAILDVCKEYDIKIIAYNVLSWGLLTGKFSKETSFQSHDRRSLLPIFQDKQYESALNQISKFKINAKNEGLTLTEYAISWVLRQKHVAASIVGFKNPEQLEINFKKI